VLKANQVCLVFQDHLDLLGRGERLEYRVIKAIEESGVFKAQVGYKVPKGNLARMVFLENLVLPDLRDPLVRWNSKMLMKRFSVDPWYAQVFQEPKENRENPVLPAQEEKKVHKEWKVHVEIQV
jgi:hypothetical protein